MTLGYIWTALTQHIKPGVQGGWGGAETHSVGLTMGGRALPTWDTEKGGGTTAVYFGSLPGPDSDVRQRDESEIGITFTSMAEKTLSHSWPEMPPNTSYLFSPAE